MSGSGGGAAPNRIVTFSEVNFSPNWNAEEYPKNPYDGFVSWGLPQGESGSISITRSDGKILSFEVTSNDFVVQTQENVIRWSSYPEFSGSDAPFR